MIIVVTGTPGVGKSKIAMELARRNNAEYLNLSDFIIKNKLFITYEEKYQSYIIDEEKVIKTINQYINFTSSSRSIVIETIYPSLISSADKVIVLRRNPYELYAILKKRGWSEFKVAENVMAEILGIISTEAKEVFSEKVCEIDTTNLDTEKILEKINKWECDHNIDWLSLENIEEFMFSLDKIINVSEEVNMRENE